MLRIVVLLLGFAAANALAVDYSENFDKFQTGTRPPTGGTPGSGLKWPVPKNVVVAQAPGRACCALKFTYPAGINSFAEQRFELEKGLDELWIQYDLHVPTNYKDRTVTGHSGSKFLMLWATEYGKSHMLEIKRIHAKTTTGNSYLLGTWYHTNNQGKREYLQLRQHENWSSGHIIDMNIDRGKWITVTAHVALPSNDRTADGQLQLWVRHANGKITQPFDMKNVGIDTNGEDFIKKGYVLGWSNPGFDQQTVMHVDNFRVSSNPIGTSGKTVEVEPEAPRNIGVSVQ